MQTGGSVAAPFLRQEWADIGQMSVHGRRGAAGRGQGRRPCPSPGGSPRRWWRKPCVDPRSRGPAGPAALKVTTHSRSVCKPTAPIRAARIRLSPSPIAGSARGCRLSTAPARTSPAAPGGAGNPRGAPGRAASPADVRRCRRESDRAGG